MYIIVYSCPNVKAKTTYIDNGRRSCIYLAMDRLYTVKETCNLLKISRAKLYLLIKGGSLRSVKIGKKTLFKESTIQRFIGSLKET